MARVRYSFDGDMTAGKQACVRALAQMRAARIPYEAHWADIRRHIAPGLGKGLDGSEAWRNAEQRDERIINSEPRILWGRMAAGLQSGITNQTTRWFALALGQQLMEMLKGEKSVGVWLEVATKAIAGALARSNGYPSLDKLYRLLGAFGTGCMLVFNVGDGPQCEVVDIGDFWLAQNRQERVDRLVRRIWMSPRQMVDEFGEGWVGEQVARQADESVSREYEVYNLVVPFDADGVWRHDLDGSMQWVSVYWCGGVQQNEGICAIRGYGYNPIIAPRWDVVNGVYGYGPGHEALADCRSLQVMEMDSLVITGQQASPPLYAPASMRGEPALDTYPGGVVYGVDGDPVLQGRGIGRLYDSRPDLASLEAKITQKEQKLGRIFFADLFAMLLQGANARQMTAREVAERNSEKVALLGPVLTRLNNDLLDPLIIAYMHILAERGELPEVPESLVGQELEIRYMSSLHVEQQMTAAMRGVTSVVEVVALVGNLKPEALDKLNADAAVEAATDAVPEASRILLGDKEVAALRQARAEAQAAQQQQEQMAAALAAAPQGTRAVKDLSETRVRDGSALGQILEQAGGGLM